jgi:methylated-DNA-[protein]-cysteine S-methyltransferase
MEYGYRLCTTPLGDLQLVANEVGLCGVLWPHQHHSITSSTVIETSPQHDILALAELQLQEYFTGERKFFTIPLAPEGTEFQQRVWRLLTDIPFGSTSTYGQLAKKLGDVNASRAVGAANGKNKLAIVVPCHRVIGNSGTLTGFAGGLAAKEYLLNLESGKRLLF